MDYGFRTRRLRWSVRGQTRIGCWCDFLINGIIPLFHNSGSVLPSCIKKESSERQTSAQCECADRRRRRGGWRLPLRTGGMDIRRRGGGASLTARTCGRGCAPGPCPCPCSCACVWTCAPWSGARKTCAPSSLRSGCCPALWAQGRREPFVTKLRLACYIVHTLTRCPRIIHTVVSRIIHTVVSCL